MADNMETIEKELVEHGMLDTFMGYLAENGEAVKLILMSALVMILMIQWLAWIFKFGRFSHPTDQKTGISYETNNGIRHVIADLMVKVIDDFRHLLALVIILMFALALGYTLIFADTISEISDGLQAVTSTLGGIIGAIIGYYFGESAAKAGYANQAPGGESGGEVEQTSTPDDDGPVNTEIRVPKAPSVTSGNTDQD